MPKTLTTKQTAQRIGVSPRTLTRMLARARDGDTDACPPCFRKTERGPMQFDAAAVDAWLARTMEQRR